MPRRTRRSKISSSRLRHAGATLKDVVKINNYLVDMSHIAIFREVRDAHFNMSAPPASTTVAISQLARPGALFEIEAIAVLPAKGAKALPRRNPQSVADLQRRAERSEASSRIMGRTPAGRRRASAMRIPWWAWAWPAGAWLILLLTPFLQIRGLVAAIAGAALIATVFAAVYHAEVVAHRTGEPFGTLVLAVAVTVIEVALIVSVMIAVPTGKAALARDTVFAAVMIVCNGIVGLCLLWGGARHHEQGFQLRGASAALAVLAALTILTLVLPNVATTTPGPYFSTSQLVFAGYHLLAALWLVCICSNRPSPRLFSREGCRQRRSARVSAFQQDRCCESGHSARRARRHCRSGQGLDADAWRSGLLRSAPRKQSWAS